MVSVDLVITVRIGTITTIRTTDLIIQAISDSEIMARLETVVISHHHTIIGTPIQLAVANSEAVVTVKDLSDTTEIVAIPRMIEADRIRTQTTNPVRLPLI